MVGQQPPQSDVTTRLTRAVSELEETVRRMELESDRLRRQRWRQLLVIGLALSLVAHIVLMFYLGLLHRAGGSGPGPQPVATSSRPARAAAHRPEAARLPAPRRAIEFDQPITDEATSELVAGGRPRRSSR